MVWRRKHEQRRRGGTPWWSIVALVVAIGVAFGLTEWHDSGRALRGFRWEGWVIQAVWWTAMLVLLWATVRDGRRARGLAIGYVVIGVLAHVYRATMLVLPASSDLVTLSRQFLLDYPYFASITFFLLWVGLFAWLLLGVGWIRRGFTRIARLDLPVLGILVFLALFFVLREVTLSAGGLRANYTADWIDAVDFISLLLPLLLYIPFLMFQQARQRRRALEWVLVGGALLLAVWIRNGAPAIAPWLEDAGVMVCCVGLLGWILPRASRSVFASVPAPPPEPGLPSEN